MTGGPQRGVLVLALALAIYAERLGTHAVGGSDSSCYGLLAQAVSRGETEPASALAIDAPWPDAKRTTAPGGFVPSAQSPSGAAPVCAPGYAWLTAPVLRLAGAEAWLRLSSVAGVLLVWATFLLAQRLAGAWAGLAAAGLVASSPVLLFQVVQPMTDVASAAAWLWALVALTRAGGPRWWLAGSAVGMALLMRPNLLPVGLLLGMWVLWADRFRGAVTYAVAVMPWGLAVLALNAVHYGSPLRSGYGSVGDLFSWAHLLPNAEGYARALVSAQFGMPLAGVLAVLLLWWRPPHASTTHDEVPVLPLVLVAAGVIASYLPYRHYSEWWYLRFLLPALVVLTVAPVVLVSRGVARASGRGADALLLALTVIGMVAQWHTAEAAEARSLRSLESRFRTVGRVMATHVSPGRAVLSVWDSGSLRFAGRDEVVLWDALDPQWLDRAVDWLAARGEAPVIVIEPWEEAAFRARFAGQQFGVLDWPPRVDIDSRVRIYLTDDRARYLSGAPVETTLVPLLR
jgi:hypothetical protein